MITAPPPTQRPPVIELIDLHKVYRVGTELVHALRGTTLTVRENEYVAIMGASGSGKSTMLNILGCLDVPTSGVYRLSGRDVSKLSQTKLAHIRGARIGFVFQSFELLGRTTALKNVELPLTYTHTPQRRQRALDALRRVNLLDRAHHRPNQLTGGQKQRVAIARALAQQPDIILADEPHRQTSRHHQPGRDHGDPRHPHARARHIIIVTHGGGHRRPLQPRHPPAQTAHRRRQRQRPDRQSATPTAAVHTHPRPTVNL
jgi:putative ABC transport system ATP-binding protein